MDQGAQDAGTIRYTPNTFVYVSKDPNSGTYLIERVVPNYITALVQDFDQTSDGTQALSGFLPGGIVPQTYYKGGDLNFAELFGVRHHLKKTSGCLFRQNSLQCLAHVKK